MLLLSRISVFVMGFWVVSKKIAKQFVASLFLFKTDFSYFSVTLPLPILNPSLYTSIVYCPFL